MLDSLRQFFRREYDDECLSFSLFLQYTRRLNPDARRGLLRTVVIDVESECPPIASYAGAGEMANPGVQLHLSPRQGSIVPQSTFDFIRFHVIKCDYK